MYLSLLQIKNFRCFDGNEHSITFEKGLNVLVGENDSGKSAIMDAIKLVLGTTDVMHGSYNWTKAANYNGETLETSIDRELVKKFADQFIKMYTEGKNTDFEW